MVNCYKEKKNPISTLTHKIKILVEPEFVNVDAIQESIPSNRFLGSLKGLQIRALVFTIPVQGCLSMEKSIGHMDFYPAGMNTLQYEQVNF